MSYPQPSVEGDIQHLLTEDLGEQGVTVLRENETLVLCGEVLSPQRRDAIEQAVVRAYPDLDVRCELTILPARAPQDQEEVG